MPLPNEDFQVFLSHSAADGELTQRIRQTLDRLHIRTFVYENYRSGGANRFEKIKTMIKQTEYFLALLTDNGLQSQWVNQEIGYAVGANKMLIPILEIKPETGERLESRGFVELHDPILLNPHAQDNMFADLVYTFYSWQNSAGKWFDTIWLTCNCGTEFDGRLNYSNEIGQSKPRPELNWNCPVCNNILSVGFPSFELRFLE